GGSPSPKTLTRPYRTGGSASSTARQRCTRLGAVEADHLLCIRQLAPVVDQEAAHAGELILLLGLHLDRKLLVGQVRTGELEGLGGFRLVLVDLAGVVVVATCLELFDALFGRV